MSEQNFGETGPVKPGQGQEGEISPEREIEIKEFLLGLFDRQIDELEEHKRALQSAQGERMSEAAREGQMKGCERDIKLIRDAIKLLKLEELR